MNLGPIIFEVCDEFDGLYTLTILAASVPRSYENLTAEEVQDTIGREMKHQFRW